ncbi:YMGG-like glycine zipper-containing protein [Wohlfahrtiimonas chitiniclastica]|uniref:YMGG-like glycine zipper-containing protein n=1 Tax=Wohlfahrtiimonas chitiniclastica TaxID=400946 RepID=UPI000B99293A|nr:YMGG-like glycine zipper-containing protein [Wohlfahrtiimonas chitiniclastica]OYQ76268.1 hypothetical protein B9T18_02625 [Wohlfahrtiimonas chitiniclastica]
MNHIKKVLISLGVMGLVAACASNDPYRDRGTRENVVSGALIGTAVGAGVGALSSKKHRGRNAAIGAGIGAAAGATTGAVATQRTY